MQNARFTRLAALSLLLAAPVVVGCRGPRVHMYPDAPVVEDGVRIAVRDAWKRGDRLVVRADVVNRGPESISVSRSDFALRLDDGSTLQVRGGRRATREIHIAKGRDATVTMEFDAPEVREISTATLLIASTSGRDSEHRTEVKLATATNAKGFGKDRHAKKRRKPAAGPDAVAAIEADVEASAASDEEDDELYEGDADEPEDATAESDDAPDEAEAEAEAEAEDEAEDWVIGSN